MSKIDIRKVLGKKKLTGEEIGKLLLLSDVNHYKQVMAGNLNPVELFTQAELDKALNGLDSLDIKTYNHYVGLYNVMHRYTTLTQGYEQQLSHGYYRILGTITNFMTVLNFKKTIKETMPYLMTKAQYDKTLNQELEKSYSYKHTYFDVFDQALSYYMNAFNMDLNVERPKENPLKGIVEKYKDKLLDDEHFIELSNACYGYGDYFFKGLNVKDFAGFGHTPNDFDRLIEGLEQAKKERNTTKRQDLEFRIHLEHHIEDYKEAKQEKNAINQSAAMIKIISALIHCDDENKEDYDFKPSKENIDKTTYYDLLDTNISEWLLQAETEEEDIENFKRFKKIFPEVCDIIEKDIYKHKKLLPLKDLKPKDYYKGLITGKDFNGLYGFSIDARNLCNVVDAPIAILDEESMWDWHKRDFIDENGDAIQPKPRLFMDTFFSGEHKELTKKNNLAVRNNVFVNAVEWLYAIDTFYKLVAETTGVKEIESYCPNIDDIVWKIQSLNNQMLLNRDFVGFNDEETWEYLKELMPLIKESEYMPKPENIEKAKEYIRDIRNFNGSNMDVNSLSLIITGEI